MKTVYPPQTKFAGGIKTLQTHDISNMRYLLYSYFMPVCSIIKTITPRCRGQPDALVHEAHGVKAMVPLKHDSLITCLIPMDPM